MKRWRVGFVARKPDCPWWYRLLARDYAHCWAARRLWRDCWLWIEWQPDGLCCGVVGSALVLGASRRAAVVLAHAAPPPSPRPRLPILSVHSCAAITAHALGLGLPFATPRRVARALLAAGARPITRPEVTAP